MLSRNASRNDNRRLVAALPALPAVLLAVSLFLLAGCSNGDAVTTADLSVDSGGSLQIEETEHDFGEVPIGETMTHSFEIRNSGEGTLRLGDLEVKMLEGC